MVQMGMRTLLVSGLAAALLINLCAPIPASATPEATTIYVADEVAVGAGGSCASPDVSTLAADDNVALQSAIALVDQLEDDPLDTVYICNGTYELIESLTATGTVNLLGESAAGAVLDGGEDLQILTMTSGSVEQLTFTNGLATDEDGGAIRASGALDVLDSIFVNNVTNGSGGAIAAYGDITVSDSTFEENRALFDGGAIWGLAITVLNSTFTGNYVGSLGGAIFSSTDISVEATGFSDNSADFGGALYSYEQVSVVGGSLTDNEALGDGGAIWGSLVSIESALLQGNCADSGGAVFANSIVYSTSNVVSDNCGGSMQFEVEITIEGSGAVINDQSLPDCEVGVCTLEFEALAILTGDPPNVEWSATDPGSLYETQCIDESCSFSRAIETPVLLNLSTTIDEEESFRVTALFPPITEHAVTVAVGAGSGSVSDGGSLYCDESSPTSCEVLYEAGSDVVLTADPSPGYSVSFWSVSSGASCSGSVCTLTDLQEDTSVEANFLEDPIIVDPGGSKRHELEVQPPSIGVVQVLDLFAGDLYESRSTDDLCRWAIRSGRLLLLTIAEMEGSLRTTWSGCTSADAASCNISLTRDHSVTVQIRQRLTSWFKRGQAVFRDSAAADLRAMASALQGRNEQDQVLIKGFAKYRLSLARDRARMLRRTLRDLGVGGQIGFDYAIAAPNDKKARAIVAIRWADRA